MKYLKHLLIGASVAIALETTGGAAAIAGTLTPTDIQFNTTNINTWLYNNPANPTQETVNGVKRRVLDDYRNSGNTAKAIQALTDNDSSTNVELWTNGETVTNNVGFSAKLGKNTLRVDSVTLADWSSNNGQLAKSWLDGFLGTYDAFILPELRVLLPNRYNEMLAALQTKGLYSSGDPNIGGISYDTGSKQLQVDLVGHLDRSSLYVDTNPTVIDTRRLINGKPNPNRGKPMPNPNYLKPKYDTRYATGSRTLDDAIASIAAEAIRQGKRFQMSEIAKITFNTQVDYAFGFAALDSGAIAGDRNKTTDTTSHTGVYSWTKRYPTASTPEPSLMLGMVAIAGLGYSMRKKSAIR